MICHVFTGPTDYTISTYYKIKENELVIGVDQGAYYLAKNQFKMDLAIGDFDSVSTEEFNLIKQYAKTIRTFAVKKDYTDTRLAIDEAFVLGYDTIKLYGGVGKRFDHSYANMQLLRLGNIEIINDSTKMYVLHPGKHYIQNEFPYISFFALETVYHLQLQGFLYELKKDKLTTDDSLCISNQGSGTVTFHEGLLLVIEQRD